MYVDGVPETATSHNYFRCLNLECVIKSFGGRKSEPVLNLAQNEKISKAAQHKSNQKVLNCGNFLKKM